DLTDPEEMALGKQTPLQMTQRCLVPFQRFRAVLGSAVLLEIGLDGLFDCQTVVLNRQGSSVLRCRRRQRDVEGWCCLVLLTSKRGGLSSNASSLSRFVCSRLFSCWLT